MVGGSGYGYVLCVVKLFPLYLRGLWLAGWLAGFYEQDYSWKTGLG